MRFLDRFVDLGLLILAPLAAPFLYVAARKRSSLRLSRQFQDLIGVTVVRNHYYEPVFTQSDICVPTGAIRSLPGLDLNLEGQLETLDRFCFGDELRAIEGKSVGQQIFRYGNQREMFAEGDAKSLYSFIRAFKPRAVVEIGAGQSSLVTQLAIRQNQVEDASYAPRHICFEPFENGWLEKIGAQVRRERIERTDLSIFQELVAGDIVFVDSSHVVRTQGDVECIFLRILPVLRSGVLVHIHDIFTPHDYTHSFIHNDRRFWSEQYILEAFLSLNPQYEVILALNYLNQRREPKLYEAFPNLAAKAGRNPGSFWIRRR